MDVVSAVASFIAIGQALAATPKIIDALQSLFGARREIVQLLNDVEVLKAFGDILRDTIQCLPEADADARLSVPKATYPLVKRIEKDMSLVVSQLGDLCRACQQEGKKQDHIKVARVKWLWYQRKIASLSRKVKENRECLQLILSCTSLYASTSHGKMLLDIHAIVTTQPQQTPFALPPSQFATQESHDSESIKCAIADDDTSESIENTRKQSRILNRQYRLPQRFEEYVLKTAHANATRLLPESDHGLPTGSFMGGYNLFITALRTSVGKVAMRLPANGVAHLVASASAFPSSSALGRSKRHCPLAVLLALVLPFTCMCHAKSRTAECSITIVTKIMQAAALARGILIDDKNKIYRNDRGKAILRDVIALDDENTDGFWPVHEAIRTGGDLIAALKESPDDIDVLDDTGNTPLHLAVTYHNNEAMQFLISCGAKLSCSDIRGDPPLLRAAQLGYHDQVQLLIDAGWCDIESRDRYGRTPLFCAAESSRRGSGKVARLLLHYGACPFDRDVNVLLYLTYFPHAADIEEKFQLFFHAGVDMEEKDGFNNKCLMLALMCRNGHLLRLLIDAGCSFDEGPRSPRVLEQAACCGCVETIDILEQTSYTVDVRGQHEDRWTPLETFEWRMNCDPSKDPVFPLSDDDIDAFYNLLRGVRDRYLTAEIQTLEKVIMHIETEEITAARETLKSVIQEKIGWNIPAEYRTFRAIDVQIREGMMEAAIESLEEFIEVSKERIGSDPRGNAYFYEPTYTDEGILIQDQD
ncbi:ankyrin [Daldinia caldariorum]|uniref:ankyrin n=1 Tax=Daldinia caldariorum TaxID=326644 RepID=UPI0020079EDA|nr:ankyrin [Daldinia caldariorum]KAI1463661.1 ankyrin [Daldinia caldariorum]